VFPVRYGQTYIGGELNCDSYTWKGSKDFGLDERQKCTAVRNWMKLVCNIQVESKVPVNVQ
jgi:hypothetical protein